MLNWPPCTGWQTKLQGWGSEFFFSDPDPAQLKKKSDPDPTLDPTSWFWFIFCSRWKKNYVSVVTVGSGPVDKSNGSGSGSPKSTDPTGTGSSSLQNWSLNKPGLWLCNWFLYVLIQGDHLNIAVLFWYLAKRDSSSVGYCTVAYASVTLYKVPEIHGNV